MSAHSWMLYSSELLVASDSNPDLLKTKKSSLLTHRNEKYRNSALFRQNLIQELKRCLENVAVTFSVSFILSVRALSTRGGKNGHQLLWA